MINTEQSQFKIAVITTVYYPLSHADVIVSRWIKPFEHDDMFGWGNPKSKIVSMYVDQFPVNDMARKISSDHNIRIYDSVEKALTLDVKSLAVDAVLLIGEHGTYPENEFGQKLYPRKELFDKIIEVFKRSGKVVPLFCDKHLSWNPDWADEMIQTVRDMKIPFMAGSTAPFTGTVPSIKLTDNSKIKEAIGIYNGELDAYGFHSLEFVQSFLERREGGESGVKSVKVYLADQVWDAMAKGEWSEKLFHETLHRIKHKKVEDIIAANKGISGHPRQPAAFCLEHLDGTRVTHIQLHGFEDFAIGLHLERDDEMLTARLTWGGSTNGHFAMLNHYLEEMFFTKQGPLPLERTLLTTKTLARCLRATKSAGQRFLTSELHVSYQPYPNLKTDFLSDTRPLR